MSDIKFYVLNEFDGAHLGPYSLVELLERIESRKIKKKTLVCRAGSNDWSEAEIALKKLFQKVADKKQAAKMQAIAEKEEAKRIKLRAKESAESARKEKEAFKIKEHSDRKQAPNNYDKGSGFRRFFGTLSRPVDPSPYWGFEFQAKIINLAALIVILASLLATLAMIVFGVRAAFMAANWWEAMLAVVIGLTLSLSYLLFGFFVSAFLIFHRNFLDWMIDVESHLRNIKTHPITNEYESK